MAVKFTFIRHAECHKNLQDITGGDGASLTLRGKRQAVLLATKLARQQIRPKIICCPAPQTRQTALILAEALQCDVEVEMKLLPAGLGIIGGLRQSDIETTYPDYAELLRKWRNLEIEAHELRIPGIEEPQEFWNRTIEVLRTHKDAGQVLVVATRSIMVFAANLSMGNSPAPGDGYKHVAVEHCSTIEVDI